MHAGEIIYPILAPLFDDKVYPLLVPESVINTSPYAVYTPISAVASQSLDGHMGDEWVRVQIDVYHHDYDELLDLSSKVTHALNTQLGLKIFSNYRQSIDDRLFRVSLDVEFWQKI
ncbi:hypothetical protein [Moraxella sp.]|uniref:hypothetical protein n=1 Tax=Moraxella sp. TaxID=479 RepID=UPI0026DD1899|nr:hypothetical protein [Moraxella sp.]MDO4895015.1 hypothetical protein [Moraxella sp.]